MLYYQSLRRGNTVIAPDGKKYASSISNAKISLSDIINKNYNNSELINYGSTCYAEEIY